MAYTAKDNDKFFRAVEHAAHRLQSLRAEINVLLITYQTQASPSNVDDVNFVDTDVATKDELKAFATNILANIVDVMDGTQVGSEPGGRETFLAPFLTDYQV